MCRLGLLAHPTEIDGRLVLGTALMALARHDEVLAEMRVALELDPENPHALALKGQALMHKGDLDQAVDVLARAVSAAPSDGSIRSLYGQARAAKEGHGQVPDSPDRLGPPPPVGDDEDDALDAATLIDGAHSGTMELDPEVEGIEVERSDGSDQYGAVRDESQPMIELSSEDLVEDEASVDAPFEPRSAGALSAIPPVDARVDEARSSDPRSKRASAMPLSSPAPAQPARPSDPIADAPPLDEMFPEDEAGVSSAYDALESRSPAQADPRGQVRDPYGAPLPPGQGGPPRAHTEDMRMIRQGLGLSSEPSSAGRPVPHPAAPRPQAHRSHMRSRAKGGRRSRGVPLIVYALLALLVVGGAVFVGFRIRSMRLERQVSSAVQEAQRWATRDTYTAYQRAMVDYDRVLRAKDSSEVRALRARLAARMAYELGFGVESADKLVGALDSGGGNAWAARGFLALAKGDLAAASQAADKLAEADKGHADLPYLRGVLALRAGDADGAIASFQAATEKVARPSAFIGLARAHWQKGAFDQALAALERAKAEVPDHPHATIWQARTLARAGRLAQEGEPEAALDAILAEGSDGKGAGSTAAANLAAWAALARAEVRLARGDVSGAREGLRGAVAQTVPDDVAFFEGVAELAVEQGDVDLARQYLEKVLAAQPDSARSKVLAARVHFAAGDVASASEALEQLGDLTGRTGELILRGRVRLALGELDGAAADLDAALAADPDHTAAILARARIDLALGEPHAAEQRMAPLVADPAAASGAALAVYAAALRESGKLDQAREILTAAANRLGDGQGTEILLERARLERATGELDKAAELYEEASASAPGEVVAAVEQATLLLDRGKASEAREAMAKLVAEHASDGRVLIEAARLATMSGDHEAATNLLDRAATSGAPGWKVAREQGRLLLASGQTDRAVVELERAKALEPVDEEIHILLMRGYWLSKNTDGASREAQDVIKTFSRGKSVGGWVRGIQQLVLRKAREAAAVLEEAYATAKEEKSTPRRLAELATWVGRAHYFDGNMAAATTWLNKALGHDKHMAEAHYVLGQIAFEAGQAAQMVKHYTKVTELEPAGYPAAWYFVGEHYMQAKPKKAKLATPFLERYLELWPSGDFAGDARALLGKK